MRAVQDPSFTATLSPPELIVFGAVALVVGGLVILATFRMPFRYVLAMSVAAGLLQFYGPFGFMSGALFLGALTLPAMVVRTFPQVRRTWPAILITLAIWQSVSVLWSASVGSAAYGVLGTSALLAIYLNSVAVLAEGPESIKTMLRFTAPFVWIHSLLTLAFRVSPVLEMNYLTSLVAPIFTEPGVESIAHGGQANVLDPAKAGGLFLNGNVASLALGMTAVIFCIGGLKFSSRWFYATAIAACLAALCTGSKSVLVILTLGTLFVLLTGIAVRHGRRAILVGSFSLVGVALSLAALPLIAPGLVAQATRTLGERGVLWSLVAESFPQRWFFGFGFGNWRNFMIERMETSEAPDATTRILPPHNLFLQAWVDAGLVSLVLTLLAAAIPIVVALRAAAAWRHVPVFSRNSLIAALVLLGVIWPIAHGMTDTTLFFGDNHTIALYGFLVAYAFRLSGEQPVAPGTLPPARSETPLSKAD